MNFGRGLLFALACAAFVGCKDDDTTKGIDEVEYDLFPTTRLLQAADLELISEDRADGTLTFTPAPASLADLEAGMVLIGGASSKTPMGLIRGVGQVTRSGNSLVLRTMVVPPQMAFKRLAAHSKHDIPNLSGATERNADEGALRELRLKARADEQLASATKELRWVLFDGDGDEETEDDQIRLEGELGGGFSYDARFDIDWGAVNDLPGAVTDCLKSIPEILEGNLPDCTPTALLPEAKATFDVGPDLEAHADLIGAASLSYEKELKILQLALAPIPVGPLVLVPGVDIIGKLEGSAGAHFKTGVDAAFAARMQITASTKSGVDISPPRLTKSDVDARPTELSIMAGAKVSLGARLSINIYGVVGPYAQANAFAEVQASAFDDPCWSVEAGLSINAGLTLTSPRLPVLGYVVLFDIDSPSAELLRTGALASGSCSASTDTPLPGAGPNETSYGNPTFATWSTVSPLPGDAAVLPSPLGADLAFTTLARTTDGRFVLAANGSERLRKIDESGAVTWEHGLTSNGVAYDLGHVAVLRDASIIATAVDVASPAVVRLGESGAVAFGHAYDFDGCAAGRILAVQALPPTGDADGAAYAFTGDCIGTDDAYLATARADGGVVRATKLGAGDGLSPRALAIVGESLWWLGLYEVDATAHVAAIRFDLALNPQVSSAYLGACDGNRTVEPAFGRAAFLREELLVVGSSAGQHEGLFMRLRKDATIAIAAFPSYGPGASDVGVLHAIAELPTTGYVVAGSHVDVLAADGAPQRQVAPFLSWLDAAGSVLAAKRLELSGGLVPAGVPNIALTNDGGLVIASTRNAASGHELWAMKVFARDATVSDPDVTAAGFPFQVVACGMTQVTMAIGYTPIVVSARSIPVSASN